MGGSLLALARPPSAQDRRGHHRVVAVRHLLQQLRRHLHVLAGHEISVQCGGSVHLSLPVHPELRRLRVELQGRDDRPVRAGRLGAEEGADAQPRRPVGQGLAVPGRQPQLRAAHGLCVECRRAVKNGHPRQQRRLLRHDRVLRDQPRVELRSRRPDDDRSTTGRSPLPDVPVAPERVPDRYRDRAARDRLCARLQGA